MFKNKFIWGGILAIICIILIVLIVFKNNDRFAVESFTSETINKDKDTSDNEIVF